MERRRNRHGDTVRIIAGMVLILMLLGMVFVIVGTIYKGLESIPDKGKGQEILIHEEKDNAFAYSSQIDETVIGGHDYMTLADLYTLIENYKLLKLSDFDRFKGECVDEEARVTMYTVVENGWEVCVAESGAGNHIRYARLFIPGVDEYANLFKGNVHRFIYDNVDEYEMDLLVRTYEDILLSGHGTTVDELITEHRDAYETIVRMRPVGLQYLVPMLETKRRGIREELAARIIKDIIMQEVSIPLPEGYNGLLQCAVIAYEDWEESNR